MALASQKPLPDLPNTKIESPLTKLSVEARAHLRKFIRHALSEEGRSLFSESQREAWAIVLEDVHNDLGECVATGEWLVGAKKRSKWRMSRKHAAKMAQEDKGSVVSAKGKNKQGSKLHAFGPLEHKEREESQTRSSARSNDTTHDPGLALEQLRILVSKRVNPLPNLSATHLLLSAASFDCQTPTEDSGFDIVPLNPGCVFEVDKFSLPDAGTDEKHAAKMVLCGLDEWDGDPNASGDDSVHLVGGTFFFKGVSSPGQHAVLLDVLRVTTYVHLSLLLEQHFLTDSSVEIHIPEPDLPPTISLPFPSPAVDAQPISPVVKPKHRRVLTRSGILSFISSKTETLVNRAASIRPLRRRGSLDVSSSPSTQPPRRSSEERSPTRLRRFSIIPDAFSSPSKPTRKLDKSEPLSSFLKNIEKNMDVFSTSVGVAVEPPALILSLAEKEKNDPLWSPASDEKAGLRSILGWSGEDGSGNAMSGNKGVFQHQQLSVLYSEYVPSTHLSNPSGTSSSSSSVLISSPPQPTSLSYSTCGRPRWITYRYYTRGQRGDTAFGEAIIDLCTGYEKPCKTPGCELKTGQHQRRLIHGGLKIIMEVGTIDKEGAEDEEDMEMWLGCKVCDAKSKPTRANDGTYLFSFAKFLEALAYSPTICTITPALCEHTTPPPPPWPPSDLPLPKSRLNIVRYFSYRSRVVSVSLSEITDIFELRIPRLQIVHSGNELAPLPEDRTIDAGEEKKTLRREIMTWWRVVAEYIDTLDDVCAGDNAVPQKALPRLPSMYEPFDESEPLAPASPEHNLLPQPPPKSDIETRADASKESTVPDQAQPTLSRSATPTPRKEGDLSRLLSDLRYSFQREEQAQYALLGGTPVSSLNDVRWSFRSSARGAKKRIVAWEKKHLSSKAAGAKVFEEKLAGKEPEWWKHGFHAVPGGNVIVREGDWGSIIAFTLSSVDFRNELANMSNAHTSSPLPSPTLSQTSSLFSAAKPYKIFTSGAASQPDPDQDDTWQTPEPFSAVISRKQHPRDPSSLLSIRDVLRQRAHVEGSNDQQPSILSNTASRNTDTKSLLSGQSVVEVNNQVAEVVAALPEGADLVGKNPEVVGAGLVESNAANPLASSTGTVDASIHREKSTSDLSAKSEATVGPDDNTITHVTRPPTPPPKDDHKQGVPGKQASSAQIGARTSSFTTSLTSGITNAVRYVLRDAPVPSGPTPDVNHQSMLSGDSAIDDQPHIKYDWTIGKRLKFSCTVYYAKQFDVLRHRCGLGDVFLKSLGQCANWAAEGGKSKSNFWKTCDNRFIIKTLVNAWNVADLQVLIELGPSYFRYMDSTAGKPTVLAKLLGFYTVEIRNLESGTVQSKADLLVTENLFYDRQVLKTFDLKGIQGRKVKANSNINNTQNSKTLFDGEWIEGQQRTLMLVRPHSKLVLREAIKADSAFLSKSNIMDYSLLLGVDEDHKQIACGLVDTIGSYTFAKTLEYKAKQGLNSGKDVTVIPPAEYQERFVSAIDRYFLACPDRWSRSLDDDPNSADDEYRVPSVL